MSNNLTIIGNVTREPELRYTPSGAAVCKFGVAVNKSYTDKSGERKQQTDFFNVNAWRSLAENAAECVGVGQRVIVVGSLRSRSWETDGGEKRSAVEIEAFSIGPDLTFATAAVTKNQKKDGSEEWGE